MLLYDVEFSFNCCLVVNALITLCVIFAYYVNSKRPEDDPKKRSYHPLAILLTPIWPLFALFAVSIFILRVLTYGIFMVLFIFALIFIRKPFVLEWLKKSALRIGDLLMTANTAIIRIFLPPLAGSRGSA
jgi:hypothetical protein